MKNLIRLAVIIFNLLIVQLVVAQTTEFSYQGKLNDAGTPSANYDFEFRLFNVVSGGTALATQQKLAVPVTNNVFSVTLDFGSSVFDGSNRWLEIAVKRPADATYTTLTPRHQISSVPYSVKIKTADVATNSNQLGEVNASEYVTTSTVGGSFIKNETTQQTANFNISGNGIIGGRFYMSGRKSAYLLPRMPVQIGNYRKVVRQMSRLTNLPEWAAICLQPRTDAVSIGRRAESMWIAIIQACNPAHSISHIARLMPPSTPSFATPRSG